MRQLVDRKSSANENASLPVIKSQVKTVSETKRYPLGIKANVLVSFIMNEKKKTASIWACLQGDRVLHFVNIFLQTSKGPMPF